MAEDDIQHECGTCCHWEPPGENDGEHRVPASYGRCLLLAGEDGLAKNPDVDAFAVDQSDYKASLRTTSTFSCKYWHEK